MKYAFTGLGLVLMSLTLSGQGPVGSWRDHLSYSCSYGLTAGDGRIYSSAGAALLIHETGNGTTYGMSKVAGLSETGISAVSWSDQEETLVIVYANTNVDLVRKGVITNIPDIKNKYIPGLKEIYSVIINESRAYLSGSFGIVVIDIPGRYIADTWKPSPDGEINEVHETVIVNGIIYAATKKGVFYAPLTKTGLSYFGNWQQLENMPAPGSGFTKIASSGLSLFINKSGGGPEPDSLFRIIPGQEALFVYSLTDEPIRSVDRVSQGIAVSLSTSIVFFSPEGTVIRQVTGYGWASANPLEVMSFDGSLWIADGSNGLIATSDFSAYTAYSVPGPYTNNVADICFTDEITFVTGGSVTNVWGNVYRPLQVFINSGRNWSSNILYGAADRDAMRVAPDPDDPHHYFVSSWGNGIYEFRDGSLINNFNQDNSPLSSIIPGEPYSRICGLEFDRDGNLWMTQTGVPGNVKVLKKDGSWGVSSVSLDVPVTGDMIITENSNLWVLLPRGYGILVYDPRNTPGDLSDDRYLRLQVEDDEGHVMNNLFSIAEDKDGNIWVGTDMGPVVYYNPSRVFDMQIFANKIKVPRNDGSGLADYLLGTKTITAITVDGANRKWFGTMSSGVFLVSDDGREQIRNFNTDNSPLLSDNIVTIGVNGRTGEVWFGTDAGIVSFRGDATAGNDDYSNIFVFPNPVREDYEGVMTITGLVEGSAVKITDIAGNLVHETTSNGGQATWDMNNYHGRRVNTGVYLIFCSNSDGTLSKVTKVLVISHR